jgi:hypothetical protein
MKTYKRNPNRSKTKVKQDVESTKKIVREDIYDILKKAKSRQEAEEVVKEFIEELSVGSIKKYTDQHGNKEVVIQRIISDIDSYGISWE